MNTGSEHENSIFHDELHDVMIMTRQPIFITGKIECPLQSTIQ